jgi:hypothetical protein
MTVQLPMYELFLAVKLNAYKLQHMILGKQYVTIGNA